MLLVICSEVKLSLMRPTHAQPANVGSELLKHVMHHSNLAITKKLAAPKAPKISSLKFLFKNFPSGITSTERFFKLHQRDLRAVAKTIEFAVMTASYSMILDLVQNESP